METRLRTLVSTGLAVAAVVIMSGCNSSSPPPTTSSPSTTTKVESKTVTTTDTTAEAMVGAPQRKPPAGTGNAIGRVLYDGKGAPGIEVRLCENIGFVGGCSGRTFQSKTDKNGFYVIDKVTPGDYALAVRVFDTDKFLYPTSGIMSAAKFKIPKDESYQVRVVNLWKTNLQTTSPKNASTVKTSKPQLAWKAYPNAANYKVEVRTKGGVGSLTSMETSETSVTPEKSLLNGEYQWRVEAMNADGTKIAETPADATFKVAGQAGSNTVELVHPRKGASVAGAGLTLQWKAHPLAQEYHVYLKGVKAQDPVMSFETVSGNSHKLAATLPADQYFWSVEAYENGEKVAGSDLQQFKVK